MGDELEKVIKEGDSWVVSELSKVIGKGGELVDEPTQKKRINACLKCPNMGRVKIKTLFYEGVFEYGCKLCKCPLVTKTKQNVIMRNPKNIGRSITPKEVIFNELLQKELAPEKVVCSNTNKNFKGATGEDYWAGI